MRTYPRTSATPRTVGVATIDQVPANGNVETKGKTSERVKTPGVQAVSICSVTLAQYQGLQTGMSYDAARQALGCGGIEMSRVARADHVTVMYSWNGRGTDASMNVTFQNDQLVAKAQLGLK